MKNLFLLIIVMVSLSAGAQTDYKLSKTDSSNLLVFKTRMEKMFSDFNEKKLVFNTLYKSDPKSFNRLNIRKERSELKSMYNEFIETFTAFQTFARSCDQEHQFGPWDWQTGPLGVTEFRCWQIKESFQDHYRYLSSL